MSDIEDYDDDLDLDTLDWFYIEDPEDDVGDLAENAIASPPPIDPVVDSDDWDRYDYWNDLEYDSDAYNDTEVKQRRSTQSVKERAGQKRKAGAELKAQSKRRKLPPSAEQGRTHKTDAEELAPVVWRASLPHESAPSFDSQGSTFALLKDWRQRFMDARIEDESILEAAQEDDETDMDDLGDTEVRIDPDMLRTALRANLANLTGSSAANDGKEAMLLDYVTKLLAEGGSADDIAGELADALFAKEGESVDGDSEAGGGGDFGQWVLGQAEENAREADQLKEGIAKALSPAATDGGMATKDAQQLDEPTDTPKSPLATGAAHHHPPTPASTQTASSNNTPSEKLQKQTSSRADSVAPASHNAITSKKRKAEIEQEEEVGAFRPKRVATRTFDAPTASSTARSASGVAGTEKGVNSKSKRSTRTASGRT